MCGIAGFLNLNGGPANPTILKRMIGTLEHRGPDDAGIYTDGALGLAHRRLSIIDIAGGHQPMSVEDGSLSITFNGEIFNFVELREDLERKGHKFLTRSDTEVLLHLYQEYGTDCVHRMNGQWAFAIWDARRRRLFLSRDRMGIRPLFYTTADRTFLFGSEIKALLAHPQVPAELDIQALRQVFTFWFVIPPRTPFMNVLQLPPGHSLVVEDNRIELKRYWEIDFSASEEDMQDAAVSERRYSDELCHLLLDSTRLRLRADVAVGAYLSGGLDSSITSALARQLVGSSLRTFSISFEDPELDESNHQFEVAQSLGTEHETIRCSTSEIAEVFPELMWHIESPVLRTAPAPMFLLSRLVRDRGIKVILTGEGSDEFLGGYDIYKEAKIRAFWAAQTSSARRPLLLRRLYPYLEGLQKQSPAYLQAFFQASPDHMRHPFCSHLPRWELTGKSQLFFSREVRAEMERHDPYSAVTEALPANFAKGDLFSRAQHLEAGFLLPNYLLSSQGDRVAMAHSVESRYPFLDYRVAEFAMKLPARLKMKVLNEKYLLKRTFGHMIPASIIKRPKQPYRAPDASSLIDSVTGRARTPYIENLLSAECIRSYGIFDASPVQKLVNKAKNGRAVSFFDNAALVGVASTQALVDQFIANFQETLSHASNRTRCAAVCD